MTTRKTLINLRWDLKIAIITEGNKLIKAHFHVATPPRSSRVSATEVDNVTFMMVLIEGNN
jgi:hypothetical protein